MVSLGRGFVLRGSGGVGGSIFAFFGCFWSSFEGPAEMSGEEGSDGASGAVAEAVDVAALVEEAFVEERLRDLPCDSPEEAVRSRRSAEVGDEVDRRGLDGSEEGVDVLRPARKIFPGIPGKNSREFPEKET